MRRVTAASRASTTAKRWWTARRARSCGAARGPGRGWAQVVAAGDALLHRGGVVQVASPPPCARRDLGQHLADAEERREPGGGRTERRPPGRAATIHSGPDASRARIACQALCRSRVPTSWVSSSTRSRTSPTACSVRASSGWCIAASREVGLQPTLGAVDDPPHSVRAAESRGGPDDADRGTRTSRWSRPRRRPATSVPSEVPTAPPARASDPSPRGCAGGASRPSGRARAARPARSRDAGRCRAARES